MRGSEVKALKRWSRRETESEEGVANESLLIQLLVIDPKPSDLVMDRLKAG